MKDYSMMNLTKGFFLKMDSEVMNVEVDHKSVLIALGLMNGNLAIVDTNTSQLRYMIQTSPNMYSISSLKWKYDEEDVITVLNAEGLINSFNLNTNK